MMRLAYKDLRHGLSAFAFGSLGLAVLIFAFLLLIALANAIVTFGEQGGLPQNLIILEQGVLQPEQSRIDPGLVDQVGSLLGQQAARIDPVVFRIMRVEEHPIQLRGVNRAAWRETFDLRLLAGAWPVQDDEVVVGQILADIAGWLPGAAIEIYGRTFRVAGVADGPGTKTQTIWMGYDQASRLFGPDKGAQLLIVHLDPLADPLSARDQLMEGLKPAGRYDAYLEDALIRQYATALQDLRALSVLVAGIAVLAVTLGAHNLGWLAAEERRRLLGGLRALGFSRRAVGQYLLIRALGTTALAYVLALAAAVVFLRWGTDDASLLISGAHSGLTLEWPVALAGLGLSSLATLVGTSLAAGRVLRTTPAMLLGRGPGETTV